MINTLGKSYSEKLRAELGKSLDIKNINAVPALKKITINVAEGDLKTDKDLLEKSRLWLSQISGQAPKNNRAKTSIAGFNVREGDIVGLSVTLRGVRMYDFFQKLVNIVLPQVKDFQGVSLKSFDHHGNYNLGLAEQIIFPEVDYDKIGRISGLSICITTSARDDNEARALLELLGMPFAKEEKKDK